MTAAWILILVHLSHTEMMPVPFTSQTACQTVGKQLETLYKYQFTCILAKRDK